MQYTTENQSATGDRNRTVPAEEIRHTESLSKAKFVSSKHVPIQRGQFAPRIYAGELFKHWDAIYWGVVGWFEGHKDGVGERRATMLMSALRLQAVSGGCFAKAATIAAEAGANEKTWDRLLAILKDAKLVNVKRLHKENGQQSVNLTDFGVLARMVLKALKLGARRWRKGEARISGIWVPLGELWQWPAELPGIL